MSDNQVVGHAKIQAVSAALPPPAASEEALNVPDVASEIGLHAPSGPSLTPEAGPVLPASLPAPTAGTPAEIRHWFEAMVAADLPAFDGTLVTARATADAFARLAKAENTRGVPTAPASPPGAPGAPATRSPAYQRAPPTWWRSWRPSASAA
jgi:hypothetical protein